VAGALPRTRKLEYPPHALFGCQGSSRHCFSGVRRCDEWRVRGRGSRSGSRRGELLGWKHVIGNRWQFDDGRRRNVLGRCVIGRRQRVNGGRRRQADLLRGSDVLERFVEESHHSGIRAPGGGRVASNVALYWRFRLHRSVDEYRVFLVLRRRRDQVRRGVCRGGDQRGEREVVRCGRDSQLPRVDNRLCAGLPGVCGWTVPAHGAARPAKRSTS
jgi:hypothetical protein